MHPSVCAIYSSCPPKSTTRFDGCSETGLLQTGFELACKRGPYSLMFSRNFHSSCKSRISDAHLDQQEIMDYVFSPSDNKSKAEEVLKVSLAPDCSQQTLAIHRVASQRVAMGVCGNEALWQ